MSRAGAPRISQQQDPQSLSAALVGRTFIHPAFDYVFIGGALSLVAIGIVMLDPEILRFLTAEDF